MVMITNFFIPELNNHDVQELWFQQDGATCHTARATIDLLKDTFGDRLISRFGPVNWAPRSCEGCGSPVVKVSNHGRHVSSSIQVPLKDPPCRAAMHVKSVES
ncbi:putative LOC100569746 [Trichonephila clavipes]|nr:putative LOC100569746 [Trichonephila clavipes]